MQLNNSNEVDEFCSNEPKLSKEFEEIIKWNEKEYHPFANLFPMLPEVELKELAEDIKNNGLINPVVLYKHKIIDGRNRYEACKLNEIEPTYEELKGDIDPLSYVISTNLKRRHLNSSQRAMVAAELANMKHGGDRKSDQAALLQFDISVEDAAKLLNVSVRSVSSAKEVKEKHPERIKEIQDGKSTVSAVAKETRKQDQILARNESVKDIQKDDNLYLGDCIEIMKTLPDCIVDCIIMDPPWGVDYQDSRESFNPKFNDEKSHVLELLDNACKELKRISKPDVHLYCVFGMENYIEFYTILFKYFQVEKIPLIWVKNNHTLRDFNQGYAYIYDSIFFGSNKKRLLNNSISRDVLNYDIPTNKKHKNQKPVELLEYFILNSTVEGELIIDPFMGSGSTCVAAKKNNRKYIGIELNQDSFNIANEFLKNN